MRRCCLNVVTIILLMVSALVLAVWIGSYWRSLELVNWTKLGPGGEEPGPYAALCGRDMVVFQFRPSGRGQYRFRWTFDVLPEYRNYSTGWVYWVGYERGHGDSFAIPYWMFLVATLAMPAARGWRWWRRTFARKPGLCPNCGYDLRASPERCPECGRVRTASEKAIPTNL